MEYEVSPRSFFQTNSLQAERLYRTVLDLAGDTDCLVRVLAGDVNSENGDGYTNLTDMAQIRSKDGQPVMPDNVRFDVNFDGAINLTDMALVKSLNGGSATCP